MKKILFVCLGNICRSPMAEGMMRNLAKDAFYVDSAATSRYQIGEPPHPGTQKVLQELAIPYDMMVARQITQEDFRDFDYIIAMDANNIKDLKEVAPLNSSHKIHLCMDSVESMKGMNVPDPYYTGDFKETKDLLQSAIKGWYDIIKKEDSV